MSDQWETFCDECYYHMWRLRRKTERGWNDGFHINTRAEAEGLCELLNKLERELAAANEERDELKSKYRTHHDEAERITNEIRRVSSVCRELREQRDKLAEELDALKQSILDLSHPNMKLLLEERNDAKEQRDRLAEAIRKHRDELELTSGDSVDRILWNAIEVVEGGSDE